MIQPFIESWSLFLHPYLLTILSATVLAMVGVIAVARQQVFIAAAVSQASTFGYSAATMLAGMMGGTLLVGTGRDVVTVGSAVAAALVTMFAGANRREGGRVDGDEITAWVFIISGAGAILMLSGSPAGMEQLRRIQGSTVIGAGLFDVVIFASLLAVGIVLLMWFWRELVLLLSDPVMAAAVGMRVGLWNLMLALSVGLVIGFSVRSTGMLFTFGCMAFPAMLSKQLCGQIRSLFYVAPLIGLAAGFVGLWLAYVTKLPPGLVVVVLLGAAALVGVVGRLAWDRFSAK